MHFSVKKHIKKRDIPIEETSLSCCFVEVTGLEPATAWSQTRNATNCATPRFCGCKGTKIFRDRKIITEQIAISLHYLTNHRMAIKNLPIEGGLFIYLIMPCSTKIFFNATTERSTCSLVCVAIRA